jgi:hypothetical protein
MTIQKLIKNEAGKYEWIEVDSLTPKRIEGKEDLTVDGYINKHGGIFSHADSKIHYSKQSYMDGIKAAGCHIKDYK